MRISSLLSSLSVPLLISLGIASAYADPIAYVNAYSENNYEINPATNQQWLIPSPYRDPLCGGFLTKMGPYSDAQGSYFGDLRTPNQFKEGTDGSNYGLDTVDFAMICTHGGASTTPNVFALGMYSVGDMLYSTDMRLGDDNNGLSVYLAYACETFAVHGSHANYWQSRWLPVFKGGLKFAAGFWQNAYYSATASHSGSNYAECIHGVDAILDSCWQTTMLAANNYNTPMVMATGTNYDNAIYRLFHISMTNWHSLPKLSDNQIQSIIYAYQPNPNVPVSSVYGTDSSSPIFGQEVPLYEAIPSHGRQITMDQLKNTVQSNQTQSNIRFKHDSHIDSFSDGETQIMAFDDGSHASYIQPNIRDKYHYSNLNIYIPSKFSIDDNIKNTAHAFRKSQIHPLVKGINEEEIHPLSIVPNIIGLSSVSDNSATELIYGYTTTYYRVLPKLPVIGAGSRIQISQNSRGEVYRYSYDWPELKPTGTANIISKEEYLSRKSQLTGALTKDWKETYEYCGYFDPGSTNRIDFKYKILQPACMVGYANDSQTKAFVIPILKEDQIIPQKDWPETYTFTHQHWDSSYLGISTSKGVQP